MPAKKFLTPVTEADWDEFNVPTASFNILYKIMEERDPAFHLAWIGWLYKKYRIGDWEGEVPAPDTIADKTFLAWHSESYCLFHRQHKKFGHNIVECGHSYAKFSFAFFDYSSIESVFFALDNDQEVPHVALYHSDVRDRYDVQTGRQLWRD